MEKKKEIFDIDLNSLMDEQLIDVDAKAGNYPAELLEATAMKKEDTAKEASEKKAIEEARSQMIDLEKNSEANEDEEVEDEEEEEEIQEEPSSNKTTPQSKSKTSSPLTPYAKLLKDEGVLPNIDVEKFDGTADSLKEAMIEEIMGAVEMYKDSLPSRVKQLIENYEDGVPFEKLLEIDRAETDVSKLTDESFEEDSKLQRKIVSDYLSKTTKFSETKINRLLDGFEDSGELEDEAKNALTELKTLAEESKKKEVESAKNQRKLDEEQRKKDLTVLQDKIKTSNEIIPGIKLNDKVKNNVFTSMTQPVGYDQSGRPVNRIVAARMENPIEFEMKLHYLFEITKGFTDFTKLADKGKKDSVKSFEEAVSQLDADKSTETGDVNKGPTRRSTDFLKGLSKTYNI
jgi:chemotaxis protein histidine kinase CheA